MRWSEGRGDKRRDESHYGRSFKNFEVDDRNDGEGEVGAGRVGEGVNAEEGRELSSERVEGLGREIFRTSAISANN